VHFHRQVCVPVFEVLPPVFKVKSIFITRKCGSVVAHSRIKVERALRVFVTTPTQTSLGALPLRICSNHMRLIPKCRSNQNGSGWYTGRHILKQVLEHVSDLGDHNTGSLKYSAITRSAFSLPSLCAGVGSSSL
jgi:hypothetical protein